MTSQSTARPRATHRSSLGSSHRRRRPSARARRPRGRARRPLWPRGNPPGRCGSSRSPTSSRCATRRPARGFEVARIPSTGSPAFVRRAKAGCLASMPESITPQRMSLHESEKSCTAASALQAIRERQTVVSTGRFRLTAHSGGWSCCLPTRALPNTASARRRPRRRPSGARPAGVRRGRGRRCPTRIPRRSGPRCPPARRRCPAARPRGWRGAPVGAGARARRRRRSRRSGA